MEEIIIKGKDELLTVHLGAAVTHMDSDFVFINRFGETQYQGTLNKATRRIIRDCNYEAAEKENVVFLPHFSCHSLRHTFTTQMCESGLNVKVIQDALGHADISTVISVFD